MARKYVFDDIQLADPDPVSEVTTVILKGYDQYAKKEAEIRVSFPSAQKALDRIQPILSDLQKRLD